VLLQGGHWTVESAFEKTSSSESSLYLKIAAFALLLRFCGRWTLDQEAGELKFPGLMVLVT